MSDTTTTSEHEDLNSTQEYTIAGIVILFFGVLYWLFNYGFPDINFNTNDTQPATAIVANGNQSDTQNQLLTNKSQLDVKQQFSTKEANNGDDTNDARQLQVAQSTNADTAEADDTSAAYVKQSDDDQIANNTDEASTKKSTSEDSASATPDNSTTDNTADQNAAASNSSNDTQQQVGTCTATATATANNLTQRVITDPAILKLRDHLLNGELEQSVVLDSVSFADKSAEAEISSEKQVLDLAALMLQNSDTKMLIRGHTASEGSAADSKTLSLARATAVGQQLVDACATPGNIIIMGMGDAEPLSDNNNPQNQGKNRRIDVAITQ